MHAMSLLQCLSEYVIQVMTSVPQLHFSYYYTSSSSTTSSSSSSCTFVRLLLLLLLLLLPSLYLAPQPVRLTVAVPSKHKVCWQQPCCWTVVTTAITNVDHSAIVANFTPTTTAAAAAAAISAAAHGTAQFVKHCAFAQVWWAQRASVRLCQRLVGRHLQQTMLCEDTAVCVHSCKVRAYAMVRCDDLYEVRVGITHNDL
jgi:hypothetical protein